MPQLNCQPPKKITYFQINGAVGASIIACELGGLSYEFQGVPFDEWPALKETLPGKTGLPVMTLEDGTILPESGAILRYCAAAGGLLGEGLDFAKSEAVMGIVADMWKPVGGNVPTIMTAKDWTAEKTATAKAEVWPKVQTFLTRLEAFLLPSGDRFTTSGISVGEIELFYRLFQLTSGAFPEASQGGLKKFYDRFAAEPGAKRFLDGSSKAGPLPGYFVPFPC